MNNIAQTSQGYRIRLALQWYKNLACRLGWRRKPNGLSLCWLSYLDTNLLKSIESGYFVGCAQRTDDIETVFKGAQGTPYAYYVKILGFESSYE